MNSRQMRPKILVFIQWNILNNSNQPSNKQIQFKMICTVHFCERWDWICWIRNGGICSSIFLMIFTTFGRVVGFFWQHKTKSSLNLEFVSFNSGNVPSLINLSNQIQNRVSIQNKHKQNKIDSVNERDEFQVEKLTWLFLQWIFLHTVCRGWATPTEASQKTTLKQKRNQFISYLSHKTTTNKNTRRRRLPSALTGS